MFRHILPLLLMAQSLVAQSGLPLSVNLWGPGGRPPLYVGEFVSLKFVATGGTPPYSWRVSDGTVAPGLSASVVNGEFVFSGNLTEEGTFQWLVEVTDAAGEKYGFSGARLPVVSGVPAVANVTLPVAVWNKGYSAQIPIVSGKPPYSVQVVEGNVPPGLTVSRSGLVSGTPTRWGKFLFVVRVTDSAGAVSRDFWMTLDIWPMGGPTITPTLPAGQLGTPYTGSVSVSGGTPPYAVSIVSGSLPPGVHLSADGTVTGTPTAGGDYTVSIRATDAQQISDTVTVTLRITGGLEIVTPFLLKAHVGQAFSATWVAKGGRAPYTFTATGTLPPGLTLMADGTLSGVPTQTGTWTWAVNVRDSGGATATSPMQTLTVESGIRLASQPPAATVGQPYRQELTLRGGVAPYQATTQDPLPPGLTLRAGAVLAGTPTQKGAWIVTLTVTDSAGTSASLPLNITVSAPALRLVSAALAPATEQVAYAATLEIAGGTPPYSVALASGTVPAGLILTSTGRIEGRPSAAGRYDFTVLVRDAEDATLTAPLTLEVAEAGPPRPRLTAAGVVDAASYESGPISPGELLTVFGEYFGPERLTYTTVSNRVLSSSIEGTRVLFNGTPAPLIYAMRGQLAAVVPFAAAGHPEVTVEIECEGRRSSAVTLGVAPARPALFRAGEGTQAAALNQDGSANSPASPAERGTVVVLYATGAGEFAGWPWDGHLASSPYGAPLLPVRVSIGGLDAAVDYAGAAPELVNGMLQVNARIPAGVAPGDAVPVVLKIGDRQNARTATIAVR